MEVSGLGGLTSVPHFIVSPALKIDYFEWNFMSLLVRDAAAGLHLHTINKETHIWSWVGLFVAEY